jgi:hypothetical protein
MTLRAGKGRRYGFWLSVVCTDRPVAGLEASWAREAARAESLRCWTGWGYAMTEVTNDTKVFDAMRFDVVSGDMVWTGREGTREAIRREKLAIDPGSWKFCPHQWLDERGFVDRELSRKHPYSWPPT